MHSPPGSVFDPKEIWLLCVKEKKVHSREREKLAVVVTHTITYEFSSSFDAAAAPLSEEKERRAGAQWELKFLTQQPPPPPRSRVGPYPDLFKQRPNVLPRSTCVCYWDLGRR